MKYSLKFFSIVILVNALLSSGCKTKTINNEEPVFLKLQPKPGSEFNYSIVNDVAVKQDINGEKSETRTLTESALIYHFENYIDSGILLTATYKSFKTKMSTPGDEREYNSATAAKSEDPGEQLFALLNNRKFTALIDTGGKLQSIGGIEDVLNRIKEATKYSGNAEQSFVGEQLFRKAVVMANGYYPPMPVKQGDSWTSEQVIYEELGLKTKRKLKVTAIEKSNIVISINGTIINKKTQINVAGKQVLLEFSGNETGEVKIDLVTGLIVKCELTAKGEGEISVINRSVPIEFKSYLKVVRK